MERVEDGTRSRLDAAAEWSHHLERHVARNLDDGAFVAQRVRRERRLIEECAVHHLVALAHRLRLVGEPGEAEIGGEVIDAVADFSLLARHADAAGVEAHDHVVSGLQLRDLRAHLLDDAGAFVSVDSGEWSGNGLFPRNQVGMADADADYPHDHLVGPRLIELDLLDHEWTGLLSHDCRLDVHRGCSSLQHAF